jgi:hypothetical protein
MRSETSVNALRRSLLMPCRVNGAEARGCRCRRLCYRGAAVAERLPGARRARHGRGRGRGPRPAQHRRRALAARPSPPLHAASRFLPVHASHRRQARSCLCPLQAARSPSCLQRSCVARPPRTAQHAACVAHSPLTLRTHSPGHTGITLVNETQLPLHLSLRHISPLHYANSVRAGESAQLNCGRVWCTVEARGECACRWKGQARRCGIDLQRCPALAAGALRQRIIHWRSSG